ncbi:hypothetical protein PENSPDRAFT_225074 [Peniophora sp. CONT]|nr:hypothetical protein PENSPDRAFT_225074 [Peniophora sp. CONT]
MCCILSHIASQLFVAHSQSLATLFLTAMDSDIKPLRVPAIDPTDKQENRRDDGLFKFRTVVFEAGGTRFRVPWFDEPGIAEEFQTKFTFPLDDEEQDVPGSSARNPIRLDEDVSDADFASLLKATYPPPGYQAAPRLSFDEWMSVLKLSTKWNLTKTRDHALVGSDAIAQNKTPLEKILLGKEYNVTKWLEEGYRALVTRWSGLSEEEMSALDVQTQLRILRLRDSAWEGLLNGAWTGSEEKIQSNKRARAFGGQIGQRTAVREMFADELQLKTEPESD